MIKALKRAWLITWEWAGEHARRPQKVVLVLDHRLSGATVRRIAECLYISSEFDTLDKLAYARPNRKTPYTAEYDHLDGVPWAASITCGHNPHLHARLVRNLRLDENSEELDTLIWDEIPRPTLDHLPGRTNTKLQSD